MPGLIESTVDVGVSHCGNSLTSAFLAFTNEGAWRNLDTFSEQSISESRTQQQYSSCDVTPNDLHAIKSHT